MDQRGGAQNQQDPVAVGPVAVGPVAVGPVAVGPVAVGPEDEIEVQGYREDEEINQPLAKNQEKQQAMNKKPQQAMSKKPQSQKPQIQKAQSNKPQLMSKRYPVSNKVSYQGTLKIDNLNFNPCVRSKLTHDSKKGTKFGTSMRPKYEFNGSLYPMTSFI